MDEVFQVVVMGCTGGPREGNLSGYLVSPLECNEWIAWDAGTLLAGIDSAFRKNNLDPALFSDPEFTPTGEMLREHVRAFLISHTHLDHIAGLVLNSQIDTKKAILGIDSTIDNFRDHIFNGKIWPNYGDEGKEPLKRYHYVRLPLAKATPIPNTSMHVEAYLLSHPGDYPSTAFLIEYKGDYLLYFGDTSSDALEKNNHLATVWQRVAPLIQEGKLRGIFLECSYPDEESDQVVFGHLDAQLMINELHRLADYVETSLQGLNVVVTHRKETLKKGEDPSERIAEELTALNDLSVNLIFPEQGDRILL